MSITILYIAAAMAAGLLFNRFAKLISLPNVTGYLVAGLLIGPSVLNLIPKEGTEALNVLADAQTDNSAQNYLSGSWHNGSSKQTGVYTGYVDGTDAEGSAIGSIRIWK